MLRFQHAAMATQFGICCTCADEHYAGQAARAAFEIVDRLEQQLSRFIENSDISRINGLAAGESTVIGFEAMDCLRLAGLIRAETGGAFDPSLGTGFETLVINPIDFTVTATADGVRLDLGAIGKGYAVDRVAEVLEDWEVCQAMIDAGYSSVLALEPPEGLEAWVLSLSDPGDTGVVLARVSACQQALGASGIRKGDHIVDPRDRSPVRARRAAWVSAPRQLLAGVGRQDAVLGSATAVADALSTAFMICPLEAVEACCRNYPGVEVWVLEDEVVHFPGTLGPVSG